MTQQTEYELTQTLALVRECLQSMAMTLDAMNQNLTTIATSVSTSGVAQNADTSSAINEVKVMAAGMYPGITNANILTVLQNMGLAGASVDTVRARMVDILQEVSKVMSNPFDVRAAKLVE